MITRIDNGVFYRDGEFFVDDGGAVKRDAAGIVTTPEEGRAHTIASRILDAHDTSDDPRHLCIKFDAMASHDITYVGIIQTARASGLDHFPLPYVLTNCHNSLCAVGGTINEDDHVFGLSAARRYGGIFVPAHDAVIHSFMRENFAGCGKMILGSDSHTRYGALGTMAMGEGGGELVKQLLGRTYDVGRPEVIAVRLTGSPRPGVGPHDVAIALVAAVFSSGFVKNKVLEFVGPGIAGLPQEFRNAIDVMTTETTCLSSIWVTDEVTHDYLMIHGREGDYEALEPGLDAYYDGAIEIDLGQVESMIALPFHPSNAYTIHELSENLDEIVHLTEVRAHEQLGTALGSLGLSRLVGDGSLHATQGFIGGCSGGTYDNIVDAADILAGHDVGDGAFALSIYPGSQPAWLELAANGTMTSLVRAGAIIRTAFCGPCFGAGDVPSNQGFSIRHATRNFPNREGARPAEGQVASVALMDARSIAATAINHGAITAATDLDPEFTRPPYHYDGSVYSRRIYVGFGDPHPDEPLVIGPNITDWPDMTALPESLLLRVVSLIEDDVTTTDELIPSGETSSYRSNPLRLAEFALSRRDPGYVGRAKEARTVELARREALARFEGGPAETADGVVVAEQPAWYTTAHAVLAAAGYADAVAPEHVGVGSVIYARKPGDGSAREQAASCQKVLGGWANIAREYATKRYRSNLINWGMVPFTSVDEPTFSVGDVILVPGIRRALETDAPTVTAAVVHMGADVEKIDAASLSALVLTMPQLTAEERQIILDGCLINHYRGQ
jgi:aconitate hydratase